MRAVFHLLILGCLLWCALGVAEPVQAHGDAQDHVSIGVAHGRGMPPSPADEVAPSAHHHCPVAPCVPVAASLAAAAPPDVSPVAQVHAALRSLTRAPPLQPPAA